MSGPAAGVAAAAHTRARARARRARSPSTWAAPPPTCASIADGVPETAGQRKLGDYPVRLPMVAVESIGAGGGSIARVEAHRRPQGRSAKRGRRARARPATAWAGREPTVSDANLVLGYLNPERVYGGSIRLDRGARRSGHSRRSPQRFGLSLIEAAHGVVEVANANMLRALRLVSVQRGYDLREFALIAYGGAGPVHAGALARAGGHLARRRARPLRRVLRARLPRLAAPLRRRPDASRRASTAWDAKVVEDRFRALEAQCLTPLLDGGPRGRAACSCSGASTSATRARTTSSRWRAAPAAPAALRGGLRSGGTASSTATPRARASSASTCA